MPASSGTPAGDLKGETTCCAPELLQLAAEAGRRAGGRSGAPDQGRSHHRLFKAVHSTARCAATPAGLRAPHPAHHRARPARAATGLLLTFRALLSGGRVSNSAAYEPSSSSVSPAAAAAGMEAASISARKMSSSAACPAASAGRPGLGWVAATAGCCRCPRRCSPGCSRPRCCCTCASRRAPRRAASCRRCRCGHSHCRRASGSCTSSSSSEPSESYLTQCMLQRGGGARPGGAGGRRVTTVAERGCKALSG